MIATMLMDDDLCEEEKPTFWTRPNFISDSVFGDIFVWTVSNRYTPAGSVFLELQKFLFPNYSTIGGIAPVGPSVRVTSESFGQGGVIGQIWNLPDGPTTSARKYIKRSYLQIKGGAHVVGFGPANNGVKSHFLVQVTKLKTRNAILRAERAFLALRERLGAEAIRAGEKALKIADKVLPTIPDWMEALMAFLTKHWYIPAGAVALVAFAPQLGAGIGRVKRGYVAFRNPPRHQNPLRFLKRYRARA